MKKSQVVLEDMKYIWRRKSVPLYSYNPRGCLPQFEQMQGQISSLAVQLCVKTALITQAANGKKLKHLHSLGV